MQKPKEFPSKNIPELFSVKDKVCFVTGVGGLGAAFAEAFAQNGAKLALANRTVSKADRLAEKLRSAGCESRSYALDVSNRENVGQVVGQIVRDFGRIDILIHTAAVAMTGDTLDVRDEDLRATTQVNYYGTVYVDEAVGNVMARQGWGRILNISSIDGYSVNCIDGMTYACSKAAVNQATRNFAVSLAKSGVTVNGIAPVWIWTPMMADRPGDYMTKAAATIPMGRVSNAEDYLGMAFFLASDASAYVTGQTFLVDGGWQASRVFSYEK